MEELPKQPRFPEREINAQLPIELMKLRASYSLDGEFFLNKQIFNRLTTGRNYQYIGREDGQFAEISRRVSKILHYRNKCFESDVIGKESDHEVNLSRIANNLENLVRELLEPEQAGLLIACMEVDTTEIRKKFIEELGRSEETRDRIHIEEDRLCRLGIEQTKQKLYDLYKTSRASKSKSSSTCYNLFDKLLSQVFGEEVLAGDEPRVEACKRNMKASSCSSAELYFFSALEYPLGDLQMLIDKEKVYAIRKTSGDPRNCLLVRPIKINNIVYPTGTVCTLEYIDNALDIANTTFSPTANLLDFRLEMIKLSLFCLPNEERKSVLGDNRYFFEESNHREDYLDATIEQLQDLANRRYEEYKKYGAFKN